MKYVLAQMYCEINCWKCPSVLKFILPITHLLLYNNDNALYELHRKFTFKRLFFNIYLSPLMNIIKFILGGKYVSKHWNTVYRNDPQKMSTTEFEYWWINRTDL